MSDKPSIPIEKLQALMDEWRKPNGHWHEHQLRMFLRCANQLQALIEEAKGE